MCLSQKAHRRPDSSIPISIPHLAGVPLSLYPDRGASVRGGYCESCPGTSITRLRVEQSVLSAAMAHLREVFGDPPPPLVIMLQQVHYQSLEAIFEQSWIRENFVVSNTDAPQRYFTLMMVSQHIQCENWFRVPFSSQMERDALVVDIPISLTGESEPLKKILRLCTTHLESLWESEGEELRPRQLVQISTLLK
jgi:hypothetical protein